MQTVHVLMQDAVDIILGLVGQLGVQDIGVVLQLANLKVEIYIIKKEFEYEKRNDSYILVCMLHGRMRQTNNNE